MSKTISGIQFEQNAAMRYMVKNGNQQQMKHPTMIPNVLAALVSILKRRTCVLILRFPKWPIFVPLALLTTDGPVAAAVIFTVWLTTWFIIAATPVKGYMWISSSAEMWKLGGETSPSPLSSALRVAGVKLLEMV